MDARRPALPSRRPSPAAVVAVLALVVSVGGSAYAVGKIDGKTIKSHSISGAKLKKDTVKGGQVDESTLGEVPSAAHAGTADQVGGLTGAQIQRAGTIVPFDVRMTNLEADRPLVQAGPFTIFGHCQLSGGNQNFYQVYAKTTENNSVAASVDTFNAHKTDTDFDTGDQFVITQDQEGAVTPSILMPIPATLASPSGTSISLQLSQGGHLFGNTSQTQCTFVGFAVLH
jgi:hypothetical protein